MENVHSIDVEDEIYDIVGGGYDPPVSRFERLTYVFDIFIL